MTNFYLPESLRCPICGEALVREGGSLFCGGERRHTYDIAKEGYVNLLPPGRARNAKTGDGADMVRAREQFLAGGGYDRYSREAAEFAARFIVGCGDGAYSSGEVVPKNEETPGGRSLTDGNMVVGLCQDSGEAVPKVEKVTIVDAGCGEGRHSMNMAAAFADAVGENPGTNEDGPSVDASLRLSTHLRWSPVPTGVSVEIIGVDASKYGVQTAAKRYVKNGSPDSRIEPCFVAGNIFSLPVADSSADVFTSLFAPLPDDEVRRVLKPGGLLMICAAGGGHLAEMRRVLYENPVPSGGGAAVPDGFEVLGETVIEYPLELCSNEEVMALFTMTPFYHNAPPEGRARLEKVESLTVTVQVKCTVSAMADGKSSADFS